MDLYDKVNEAADYIESKINARPHTAIILGTGLQNFAEKIDAEIQLNYNEIPHYMRSTVESHSGKLISGLLDNTPVLVMQGRFHFYEGYSMEEVTFPIRVLSKLGIDQVIITNASGSLNPLMKTGDIVVVDDHIGLLCQNPLRGITDPRLGERFPDMTQTYDKAFNQKAFDIAKKENIIAHSGTYIYVQGPSLETPAEHKMLRSMGADIVGMSTVPEVIVAKQVGLRVCVLSCVTNECMSDMITPETSLQDVINAATEAEPKLSKLLTGLVG